jgi:hypothetical protein
VKPIHSYVIRIYRRNADAFAGLIEDVQSSRTVPFHSLADLCEVLSGRKRFPLRSRRRHDAVQSAPDEPGS